MSEPCSFIYFDNFNYNKKKFIFRLKNQKITIETLFIANILIANQNLI
jgi:hypothetical protein